MKHYELTILTSPDLSSEELNNFQEKIINFLQEKKGLLTKANSPIKKNLGTPIKKKIQGFLIILEFQLNSSELKNLEKELKKDSQILRYFLISKKISKTAKIIKKPSRFPKKITEPKVELKEIEKKLEEILKEQ